MQEDGESEAESEGSTEYENTSEEEITLAGADPGEDPNFVSVAESCCCFFYEDCFARVVSFCSKILFSSTLVLMSRLISLLSVNKSFSAIAACTARQLFAGFSAVAACTARQLFAGR